jgi:hypothetical protein
MINNDYIPKFLASPQRLSDKKVYHRNSRLGVFLFKSNSRNNRGNSNVKGGIMMVLVSRFAFRLSRLFGSSLRNRVKIYFFFNRTARRDVISKINKQQPSGGHKETWREYYIKVYGEIPDFAKHINNGFYRNLDEIRTQLDIAGIIKAEEERYIKLFERNKEMLVKEYSDTNKLDGETLAKLHHTYGCDPTMVEDALNIFLPGQLHSDYLREYEKHKLTGKHG